MNNIIKVVEMIAFGVLSGVIAFVLLFFAFLYLLYREDRRDFKKTLKDQ